MTDRDEGAGGPTSGGSRTGSRPPDDRGTQTPARDDVPSIHRDDAFHLLQNPRRRAVLRYFVEHSDRDRFRMRDLAEAVAAWEHDAHVQQLSSDERQRVYIALYQTHLPKLDDHGLVDYDQGRGIVEPTPLVQAFEPFVEDELHTDADRLSVDDGREEPDDGDAGVFSTFFSR